MRSGDTYPPRLMCGPNIVSPDRTVMDELIYIIHIANDVVLFNIVTFLTTCSC